MREEGVPRRGSAGRRCFNEVGALKKCFTLHIPVKCFDDRS
jgi:hypothetical protein